MSGSGWKRTLVPLRLLITPKLTSPPVGFPRLKSILYNFLSLATSTSRWSESALTTDMPTP